MTARLQLADPNDLSNVETAVAESIVFEDGALTVTINGAEFGFELVDGFWHEVNGESIILSFEVR